MERHIHTFCLILYVSILVVLGLGSLGTFDNLYATNGRVIETFEMGPIKSDKKQVVRVKTQYEWTQKNVCPCNGENPPCIKTFLDKNLPSEEPEDVQVFNELEQSSDKYQGSNLVPAAIELSSVRILTVPFCRPKTDENKN